MDLSLTVADGEEDNKIPFPCTELLEQVIERGHFTAGFVCTITLWIHYYQCGYWLLPTVSCYYHRYAILTWLLSVLMVDQGSSL